MRSPTPAYGQFSRGKWIKDFEISYVNPDTKSEERIQGQQKQSFQGKYANKMDFHIRQKSPQGHYLRLVSVSDHNGALKHTPENLSVAGPLARGYDIDILHVDGTEDVQNILENYPGRIDVLNISAHGIFFSMDMGKNSMNLWSLGLDGKRIKAIDQKSIIILNSCETSSCFSLNIAQRISKNFPQSLVVSAQKRVKEGDLKWDGLVPYFSDGHNPMSALYRAGKIFSYDQLGIKDQVCSHSFKNVVAIGAVSLQLALMALIPALLIWSRWSQIHSKSPNFDNLNFDY